MLRTGKKVKDRQESQGHARKSRTGKKLKAGMKSENRRQSQENALKPKTGGVLIAENAVHRLRWCPAFGQAGTCLFLSGNLNSY